MNTPRLPTDKLRAGMQPLARLPVFYELQGKHAVVAGGSPAAAWKAELLLAAGAKVRVFASVISTEMQSVVEEAGADRIALVVRDWSATDLRGVSLAVGAFEDDAAAAAFAKTAREAGVPVNAIDRPAHCDFSFGAIVNRSPLVVGISTDGAAPVFGQMVRAKIEAMLPAGFARWTATAKIWRDKLKEAQPSFSLRRRFWQLFTSHAVARPNDKPSDDDFFRLLADVQGEGIALELGSVTLVGAGPGDPELLTLRAARALQSADVILFDDLVSTEILDFARREARKMLVGKTGYGPSCKQSDINDLMVGLAKSGRRVVRLKGGDPMIFGRAGEEIDACRSAGIAIDVVPGITAAQAAAAILNVSLTNRDCVRRVQYITGHSRQGSLPTDLNWTSLIDRNVTTAIYMPTKTIGDFVSASLREGLDRDTPAAAIVRATLPDQIVISGTISQLPTKLAEVSLEGPTLVMLGSVLGKARAVQEVAA